MLRVLIVEDERITAMDLEEALRQRGYEVVDVVTRGEEVVERALQAAPDIILMDIRLEGRLDGIEAAHQVRSELELPVVFLTANSDPETIRRIHETGARGYLIKPFNDDELPGVLEAAVGHHRTEEAARDRGDQLWVTLQSIGDAVITTDEALRVTHLNPAAETLVGWSAEEARGRRVEEICDLRHPDTGDTVDNPLRQALREGGPAELSEGALLLPRGNEASPVPVADTATPIRAEDGRILGGVMVIQDLSERQRLQDLIARTDRLASMGTLAASIAHEINNPLTYVLGSVHVALDGLRRSTLGREEAVRLLRDVEVGARTIEHIVRDLKLLSTQDHKALEPVDVQRVVQRSLRMVAKAVRARGRLEAALSPTLAVLAHPVTLGQVVRNLVQNAAQALPEDYSDDHVVRVTTDDDGQRVRIVVEDNGCGMTEAVQARVFDPFFTTKPVGEGSGLGMAVSYQIVRELGGELTLDSEVGRGTRVEVFLPARPDISDEPVDEVTTSSEATWTARRVLIVDDDRLVRRALQQMLAQVHTVESFGSVEAALARIRHGIGYDAILCDLMMSPLNGIEFLDALESLAPDLVRRMAFITGGVISGAVQEQVIRSGRPLAYKPFDAAQLLGLVEELAAG
jgi:two-component system, cell cycle sensor histidine kinase and response regulator CckA